MTCNHRPPPHCRTSICHRGKKTSGGADGVEENWRRGKTVFDIATCQNLIGVMAPWHYGTEVLPGPKSYLMLCLS
uniref:Uncharacterized protein n=1 Tax=Medicago truncatula TaxID=3880 RepID=A4PSD4_MEDTR|nr:hypothetical protein MtrDRAFT_AC140549g68v2 [Medicago truncatula]